MTKLEINDVVALTEDMPQNALVRGQVGTLVENLAADIYEVEFIDGDGQTYAMLPLHAKQLMPLHYLPIVSASTTDKPETNPKEKAMSQIHQYGKGDNVAGDNVAGDKIMGDKVTGDKASTQNNFNGPMSGVIASDHATVENSTFTQTNNATTAELLTLISQLRQTATQLPKDIQEDLTIDLDDVEEEIKKPEDQRSLPKIKKRLGALIAAVGIAAAPVVATTDFANTALDLGSKLGIELPIAP